MSQVTRSWLAFAAMGAGVIHLGLASGSAPSVAAALVVLGFAEFGWGVAVLTLNRFVLPRVATAVSVLPSLGWGALLLIAVAFEVPAVAAQFPVFPMAVASAFTLLIAAVLARHGLRRNRRDGAGEPVASQPSRPALYLVGLMAGALAVSSLTTPALSATSAGAANPHSHHGQLTLPVEQHSH